MKKVIKKLKVAKKVQPKSKKKVVKKPLKMACVFCDKVYYMAEFIQCPETLQYYCENCPAPTAVKEPKKIPKENFGWFVLAVEPNKEGLVKKGLLRQLKIDGRKELVKRIYIPRKFEEVVLQKKGVEVAKGEGDNQHHCSIQAQNAIRELEQNNDSPIKYRYTIFRAPPIEKGRESNTFAYKVSTINEEVERKVIQVKKYPGYLICQLTYCPELETTLKKVRGQWGLLLKPVVVGHLIQVKYSKRVGGFVWKVLDPASKSVHAKGMKGTEPSARSEAEKAKAKLEEFRPIPLKTKEAAELLISQKAVNQIAKDPVERDRAIINFKVGSTVEVTDGVYKRVQGQVIALDKSDKTNVQVSVQTRLMDQLVSVSVPHYLVRVVAY